MEALLVVIGLVMLYYVVRIHQELVSLKKESATTMSLVKQVKVAAPLPAKERARTTRSKYSVPATGRMSKLIPTRGGDPSGYHYDN